jgi:hypothetical protein
LIYWYILMPLFHFHFIFIISLFHYFIIIDYFDYFIDCHYYATLLFSLIIDISADIFITLTLLMPLLTLRHWLLILLILHIYIDTLTSFTPYTHIITHYLHTLADIDYIDMRWLLIH